MIAPRAFAVEAGVRDGSVDYEKSRRTFQQARRPYDRLRLADRASFIGHAEGHVSATARALDFLEQHLSR